MLTRLQQLYSVRQLSVVYINGRNPLRRRFECLGAEVPNMKGSLGKLEELAKLRFELHLAKLRPLAQQEASIRRAIDELWCDPSGESVAANANLHERSGALRAWKYWSSQRIDVLNVQLAQVLAAKADLLEASRLEFGRKEAIRLLDQKTVKTKS